MAASRDVSVKSGDMPKEMQDEVIQMAEQAIANKELETDIAEEIKNAIEAKYKPNWHVIVGRSFGTKVSHENGKFIFFYIGNRAFQIYKFG